jgi:hypothetical protein
MKNVSRIVPVLVLGTGLGLTTACTRVVETRTTTEIRPMRYALLEFTSQLVRQDSAMVVAKRAFARENIKLLREVQATGTIEGGPIHFMAEGDQPALDATVTITSSMDGSASRFRIYASAVLPAGAVGGIDPRLTAFVERVAKGIM